MNPKPAPSGYRDCACRDCFELTLARYCHGCIDAGCPDYQGQPGMSQECQRPDAYWDDGVPSDEGGAS